MNDGAAGWACRWTVGRKYTETEERGKWAAVAVPLTRLDVGVLIPKAKTV